MLFKIFVQKIIRDAFAVSFAALVIFSFLEWQEPGFVSNYISFVLLLSLPLVFGILTVISDNK
ncbi:hypothetical protein A2316_03460 [Candidatus Falkowbacteria bacterium RIFOXYB2_FULL_38_15]|uniref:Uncharacterized protein n=1 Tax=Candidatus Falkowbacteria bacterium RIFOXYA2_FULL_38_12 TaxID=1797993 RepID=A0A1F5S3A0_9BACT|nr:MAG: hypothetical protein A2257_01765 [Candidatus Falkowbacteria bacterium RIFOXYA2_FULL_38_12]OGF32976.1 MAG: hypothetical protein A2316_03460 [Candidatus Falkowbacteria bacterium RIFOXYB2_FULL_38_15]OGF42626.1 MAG: hypothetical protein A2555_02480 [Candidatus Falkowbacteria bacterium RIFOXYD2_FULL_39_16]